MATPREKLKPVYRPKARGLLLAIGISLLIYGGLALLAYAASVALR